MSRLSQLLRHAGNSVPYYRSLPKQGDLALADFPTLRKREFVDNLEQLLSTDVASYVQSDDPRRWNTPGVLACEFTSGSSGYPMRCLKTAEERIALGLSLFRKRRAIDRAFSPDQLFGFIHNTEYNPDGSVGDSLGNLTEENIERVLTYLRDVRRPAALHGNTMLLLHYADFVRLHDFDFKSWDIHFIESVSESITDEQKQYIGEQFQCPVYDCYGCLECYNVAYECPHHSLHINENVLLEILDLDSDSPADDASTGEIVLTSLVNRAQPFIRYRTGDVGAVTKSTCACGSEAPVLRLSGTRTIDYISLLFRTDDPGLKICGYDIFAPVMNQLAETGDNCVSWYNIIQIELDSFEIQYLPRHDFSERFFGLFQRHACDRLGYAASFRFTEMREPEVLNVNRKNRVFRSLLQSG